jgi:hypothetical protein
MSHPVERSWCGTRPAEKFVGQHSESAQPRVRRCFPIEAPDPVLCSSAELAQQDRGVLTVRQPLWLYVAPGTASMQCREEATFGLCTVQLYKLQLRGVELGKQQRSIVNHASTLPFRRNVPHSLQGGRNRVSCRFRGFMMGVPGGRGIGPRG